MTNANLKKGLVARALLHFFWAFLTAVFVVSPVQAQVASSIVYEETFETATAPGPITGFNGFTADSYWTRTNRCNGILLSRDISNSVGNSNGCNSGSIDNLGRIAEALGGGDTSNIVVSSYTNGGSGTSSDRIQLQSPQFAMVNNRYYAASIDVGAQNCFASGPEHQFAIVAADGTEILLGDPVFPCGTSTNGVTPVLVEKIVSPEPIRWTGGSSASLRLLNLNFMSRGNDTAIDNLRVIDVTPQMGKSFESPVVRGDPSTLTFTITNSDDLLVKRDIGFTDTLPSGLSVDPASTPTSTCGDAVINATGSSIVVSGADIADGDISCTITVEILASTFGDFSNGPDELSGLEFVQPPDAPALLTVLPRVELDVAKSASVGVLQADGTVDVTYSVVVENSGDLALSPLSLVDDLTAPDQLGTAFVSVVTPPVVSLTNTSGTSVAPSTNGTGYTGDNGLITGTDGSLEPGDSYSVTFTVNVDPDASGAPTTLQNTATAGGLPPGGTPGVDEVTDDSDTDTAPDGSPDGTANVPGGPGDPTIITPPAAAPAFTLLKEADEDALVQSGSDVTYTYTVTNTGNVNISDITIGDQHTASAGTAALTAAGEVLLTDAGTTGDSTDAASDGSWDVLAPGDSITFTSTYTVTVADAVDGGDLTNIATVSGTPASGTLDDVTAEEIVKVAEPQLDVGKSASVGALQADGTVDVTYTVVVENSGDAPLAPLSLVDDLTAADQLGSAFDSVVTAPVVALTNTSGTSVAPSTNGASYDGTNGLITGSDGSLEPGDSYSVTFTVNVNPAASGAPSPLQNTATAGGVPPGGTPGVDDVFDDSDTDTDPTGSPDGTTNVPGGPGAPTVIEVPSSIGLVKTAVLNDDDGTEGVSAGDSIDYTYVVTNTGTVDVFNVTVTEPNSAANPFSGTGTVPTPVHDASTGFDLDSTGTATDIGPGQTVTFTSTYTLTQADIDAGGIENSALAEGEDATGPVSDTSDSSDETTGNDAPTVVPLEQTPALELVKSVTAYADTNGSGAIDAGDTLTFGFTIVNTGNVALADVSVADSDPNVVISPAGTLVSIPVGGTDTTFTGTYELTAADVAAGGYENTAEATGIGVDASGAPLTDDTGAALTAEDTSDTGTTPQLDSDGNPIAAVDGDTTDSENLAGVADGDPGNDPTVFFIPNPEIRVTKSVGRVLDSNNDGLFGGEGDIVEYEFFVENVGNVDLVNVTIDDPLFDPTGVVGGPIDLPLAAPADSLSFTGSYMITADNVADRVVVNSATASGDAELDGAPVYGPGGVPLTATDTSDTGTDSDAELISGSETTETPNADGTTDDDPTNDPTLLTVPSNPLPRISLVKSITGITDVDGDGLPSAGDIIEYTFAVTNTGNVRLADVTIDDPLTGTTVTLPAILEIGDTDTSTTGTYTLTAANVTDGMVENTATATGGAVNSDGDPITEPGGGTQLTAEDDSDTGTEETLGPDGMPVLITDPAANETVADGETGDGDRTNDPTVLSIPSPGISVIKSVSNVFDTNGDGVFGGLNDEVTFVFTVTNTGNTGLTGVMIDDSIATVSGGPIDLAVGQSIVGAFTASYLVTATDVTNGYVENTAEATGAATDPSGAPLLDLSGDPIEVGDTSDTGTAPDGTDIPDPEGVETPSGTGGTDDETDNDPTVVSIPANPMPEISLIKSVAGVDDTGSDSVLGNEDDTVTYTFTVTNTGSTDLVDVVVNDPLLGGDVGTISALAIGESASVTGTYVLTEVDEDRGYVENTATAAGDAVNSIGGPLLDPVTGERLTAEDISDSGTNPDTTPIDDPEGTETGNGAGETDDDPTSDPTVVSTLLEPSDALVSGTVFIDNNRDGTFDNDGTDIGTGGYLVQLLDADGEVIAEVLAGPDGTFLMEGFPIREPYTLVFTDVATGLVVGEIEDLDFATTPQLTDQNQPVVEERAENTLTLTKTAGVSTVVMGETVPYTITATSTDGTAFGPVTIVDRLPLGLVYTPGTAQVNGTAVEPELDGLSLVWSGLTVPADGSLVVTLSARVGPTAEPGDLTNTANLLDGLTGDVLTAPAQAVVQLTPEAVFDCAVVIGKVFDDVNRNGYQDDARTGGITDQRIIPGKFGRVVPGGEPGLPNVRLVTPTGTIITTDEYGRYSVPCAELPGRFGTNFGLKLDTRSLPTGYRVTTENPRVMRLTAGIMTEMNFGAAIGPVLDVNLTAAAFAQGDDAVSSELRDGLRQLLRRVKDEPAMLRLTYISNGEDKRLVRKRLDAAAKLIRSEWRRVGTHRLIIERTSKRFQ